MEGIDIKIEWTTKGRDSGKGSHISEEFHNQPIEKIKALEDFLEKTVRPFLYRTLRG